MYIISWLNRINNWWGHRYTSVINITEHCIMSLLNRINPVVVAFANTDNSVVNGSLFGVAPLCGDMSLVRFRDIASYA